jgi:hypothetical protein
VCARIHLHVLLRAADTHAYPYGHGDFDSNTNSYFNTETFTDVEARPDAQVASYSATAPVACIDEEETHCPIRFV